MAFELEPIAGGCRLHHSEEFRGILVTLFGAMLENTARGFVALNDALKQRVEGR